MSEQMQPTVIQALNLVMRDVTSVSKDERNSQQGFKYRGIDATLDVVGPAFRTHGVVAIPTLLEHVYETVEIGAKRTPMAHVVAKVAYDFYGPAGDSVKAVVFSESMDSGDKAVAKAMSVAFRIALLQVLAIPTGEPDPDSYSYERSDRPQPERSRPEPEDPRPASYSDVAALAATATSLPELREAYTAAASEGYLAREYRDTKTGEISSFQDFLYRRREELDPKSGAGRSAGGAPSAAAPGQVAR